MEFKALLPLIHLDEFIVLDLETTGLRPYADGITEISAYRFVDGEPLEDFTTLINPHQPINREISELTGITDEMVADAPDIGDILPKLIDFIGQTPLVGHNLDFDLNFINHQLSLNKMGELNNRTYDTLILARAFLFFHHEFTLGAVSRYLGIDSDNAHRASGDTLSTGKVFCKLVHEAASYPLHVIRELYEAVKHSDIHNIMLFKHLLEVSVELKQVDGLTDSLVNKEIRSYRFDYKSSASSHNMVDEPGSWLTDVIPKNWPGFEPRQSQIDMANDTFRTFQENEILLAEAGTGLGKSLAYLTAGLLFRKKTDMPMLVSTYTKNLQDQLFYKDIPQLAEALNLNMTAVMMKGRQNYLCLTRLGFVLSNSDKLLGKQDCENILPLLIWKEFTETGDISDCHGFKIQMAGKLWSLVRSERGYCTTGRCNASHGCYLGRIRDFVHRADIIVVNHSLLLSDSMQENSGLPATYACVIDEGHNLEQAARDQLVQRIGDYSYYEVLNIFLNRDSSHRKTLMNMGTDNRIISQQVDELIDIAGELTRDLNAFFKQYALSKSAELAGNPKYELRIVYENSQDEFAGIDPDPSELLHRLVDFSSAMNALVDTVKQGDSDKNDSLVQELSILLEKLNAVNTVFHRVLQVEPEDVVWASFVRQRENIQTYLNCAPRDVSSLISNGILARQSGTLICSATLTVDDSFDYLSISLGVDRIDHKKTINQRIYFSPFKFNDQVRLYVKSGAAAVQSVEYLTEVAREIDRLSKELPARVLVLCTAYTQTRTIRNELLKKITADDERKLFVQNSGKGRQALMQGYLQHPRSILVGTASFWEGVDLPGDKLEILVIVKLPFANPGDPLIRAKIDDFNANGRNAFMEYQVPDATVRLKQGFGRLIRSLEDTGICIITDPRLLRTRYGRIMMDSLPVEAESYISIETVINNARRFLKK